MSFRNSYSWLDRCLHRLAFSTRSAQLGVADLENRRFRGELASTSAARPIFVTGLPRSGTTILLELISRTPSVATHIYRDMPFVLTPMVWGGFARRFAKADKPRERAHGDGIQISLDSPEAFEEMVWMAFYGDRYRGDTISPWTAVGDQEFLQFLSDHMRKVIALRRRDKPTASRYASKNNLNIARMPALLDAFGDAVALVPFRDPVQHAASLLQQHQRFTAMHRDDPFARRYMRGIGHFDFGDNLKPVDFGGWWSSRTSSDPSKLAFWLEYWCVTYQTLLENADHDRMHLVGFEQLGAASGLAALAHAAGIEGADLAAQANILAPATSREVDIAHTPADLVERANGINAHLRARCVLTDG